LGTSGSERGGISCPDLIMQLNKAHAENRLEVKLKHYAKYKLLIIDELCKASHNSSYEKLNIM